jgi:hypothetical protein
MRAGSTTRLSSTTAQKTSRFTETITIWEEHPHYPSVGPHLDLHFLKSKPQAMPVMKKMTRPTMKKTSR